MINKQSRGAIARKIRRIWQLPSGEAGTILCQLGIETRGYLVFGALGRRRPFPLQRGELIPFLLGVAVVFTTHLALAQRLTPITGPGSGNFLTDENALEDPIGISADGNRIVFYGRNRDPDNNFRGMFLYKVETAELSYLGGGRKPAISADGRVMGFLHAGPLVGELPSQELGLLLLPEEIFEPVTTDTKTANLDPSLNWDGSRIAFASPADLQSGDPPTRFDPEIWLYDRPHRTFRPVTTAFQEDRESRYPQIAGDGRRVVFRSDADLLSEGIEWGEFHVWFFDVETSTLLRLSPLAGSRERYVGEPLIGADGRRVVFASDRPTPDEDLALFQYELWFYDLETSSLARLTNSAPGRWCLYPQLSGNGRYAVFISDNDFLGQGLPDNWWEVWRLDIETGEIVRVTQKVQEDRSYAQVAINYDGRKIAFSSDAYFGFGSPFQVDRFDFHVLLWEDLSPPGTGWMFY